MERFQEYSSRPVRRRLAAMVVAASAFAALTGCSAATGQPTPTAEFPTHAIDVDIPFDPGGGTDVFARLLIEEVNRVGDLDLRPRNVPGAGGALGTRQVAEADADGYTLCFCTQGTVITASLRDDVGYTWTDFDPVAILAEPSTSIAVSADSEYETFEDLVKAARANPGEVSMGTAAHSGQLTQAVIEIALGIEFQNVPFDGSSESLQAAAGGHVDAAIASTGSVSGLVDAGLVRILTTTGSAPEFEGVPAIVELEPDALFTIWYGLLAPAGTPEEILQRIREAVIAVAQDEDFTATMADAGTPIQIMDDPEAIRERLAAEVARLEPAIQRVEDTM